MERSDRGANGSRQGATAIRAAGPAEPRLVREQVQRRGLCCSSFGYAGPGGASRSAKAEAAKSPAQSTNPVVGPGTGRMPKTATLASFTTVQDPPGVPPASASAAPHTLQRRRLLEELPWPLGAMLRLRVWVKHRNGQQTLPLESLPQPPLPAPFTLGDESTNFQEVATNGQPPNAALRVSEQQSLPFHKRFFQGYPALVEWFPNHIDKPPEEPEEPNLPAGHPPRPGLRRRSPCRSTKAIPYRCPTRYDRVPPHEGDLWPPGARRSRRPGSSCTAG